VRIREKERKDRKKGTKKNAFSVVVSCTSSLPYKEASMNGVCMCVYFERFFFLLPVAVQEPMCTFFSCVKIPPSYVAKQTVKNKRHAILSFTLMLLGR
jgi:hypothetical protein